MKRILFFLALVSMAFGCADQTAIELLLIGDELVVPDDIDQVRVVARNEASVMIDNTTDLSSNNWPQTIVLRPGETSGTGVVTVQIFGLRQGAVRIRRVIQTRFESDTNLPIQVNLTRSCLDIMCSGETTDCVGGRCTDAPPPPDAGVDSDVPDTDVPDTTPDADTPDVAMDTDTPDTDMPDTDMPDTDVPDADEPDADEPDAGMDASPDAEMDAGMDAEPDAAPDAEPDAPSGTGSIVISEYVEGSGSSNKALELTNRGDAPISLEGCVIDVLVNGGSSNPTLNLSGSLEPGESFVACRNMSLSPACDVESGSAINYNGDDAIRIVCGGDVVDRFGQWGMDPGTHWGDAVRSNEMTLRRSCSVTEGDTDFAAAFDPAVQYEAFDTDDLTGLGVDCP